MEGAPKPNLLPEGYSYHPEGYLWFVLNAEEFSDLPETLNVEGEDFNKKSEFHVTVANVRAIATELGGTDADIADREVGLQKLLSEYVQDESIRFDRFENVFRLAVSAGRKSVVVRCKMQGIEGYFDRITQKYGQQFSLQPAHVSLYTVKGMAVGINSNEQMESYKKIELPEVQKVLNSIASP